MKRINIKAKVEQAYQAALKLGLPTACPKIPFAKSDAEIVLKKAQQSRSNKRKECRIYQCEKCNMWHLTSKGIEDEKPLENYRVVNKDKWQELLTNNENENNE